jgi:hypothetical protein
MNTTHVPRHAVTPRGAEFQGESHRIPVGPRVWKTVRRLAQAMRGFAVLLAAVLGVSACGGGGGSGAANTNSPPTVPAAPNMSAPPPPPAGASDALLGYFRVPTTQGLHYCASSNLCGTTDGLGRFWFRAGDTVIFTLGTLTLGTAHMQAPASDASGNLTTVTVRVVTPWSLTPDPTRAINIASTLQMLSANATGAGAFVISEAVQARAPHWAPIDLGQDDFGSQTLTEVLQPVLDDLKAQGSEHAFIATDVLTAALTPAFRCNYSGLYTGRFSGRLVEADSLPSAQSIDPVFGQGALVLLPVSGIAALGFNYYYPNAGHDVVGSIRATTSLQPGIEPPFTAPILGVPAAGYFGSVATAHVTWGGENTIQGYSVIDGLFDGVSQASADARYRFTDSADAVTPSYAFQIEIDTQSALTLTGTRFDLGGSHPVALHGRLAADNTFDVSSDGYRLKGGLNLLGTNLTGIFTDPNGAQIAAYSNTASLTGCAPVS